MSVSATAAYPPFPGLAIFLNFSGPHTSNQDFYYCISLPLCEGREMYILQCGEVGEMVDSKLLKDSGTSHLGCHREIVTTHPSVSGYVPLDWTIY